ncbi:MAG TPA: glycosyltransferase family 2 protein [Acidimicrobiales bacterium]|nr:glycosyltransferase family 2 protein [Acidimicrobiales bacterium]
MDARPAAADAKVTAVVVTYRSADIVGACLRSLDAAAPVTRLRAVVVDNASDDGTVDVVRETAAAVTTPVELKERPANDGFSVGCNVGLRRASGEWVLFLNPDAVLRPGVVDALVDVARANPSAAIVAPALVGSDGALQPTVERVYGLRRIVLGLFRVGGPNRAAVPPDGGEPIEVEWVHAAVILMPLAVARALGGFDERYFLYAEDMDLCTRARRAGHLVLLAPAIRVDHVGGASAARSGGDGPMAARRVDGFARYLRAHEGRAAAVAYLLVTLVSAAVMAAAGAVRRRPSAVHRAMVRAAALGLVGRRPAEVPW